VKITYVNPYGGFKPYKQDEGDIKILKDGTRFIRQKCRVYNGAGECIGVQVSRGRPCWKWVRLDPQEKEGEL